MTKQLICSVKSIKTCSQKSLLADQLWGRQGSSVPPHPGRHATASQSKLLILKTNKLNTHQSKCFLGMKRRQENSHRYLYSIMDTGLLFSWNITACIVKTFQQNKNILTAIIYFILVVSSFCHQLIETARKIWKKNRAGWEKTKESIHHGIALESFHITV